MKNIFFKLMFKTLKNYLNFIMNFIPELPEKVKKVVANLHDKTGYVIYIWNLKQALNNGKKKSKKWIWKNLKSYKACIK